jgi:hypothetical protein
MEPETKVPSLDELKSFLTEYGWNFRSVKSPDGMEYLQTNYRLENDNSKGILISLSVQGEFVLVSSTSFLTNVPKDDSSKLLSLNDTLKLVKIFSVGENVNGNLDAEIGFELWSDAWNKQTFFAFMDMLCFGIEETLTIAQEKNISHETHFVTYN